MEQFESNQFKFSTLQSEKKVLKYHMTSLGCPKNLVESEEMMAQLSISGMVLVHDPEEADLLVVNTCGFIDSAKEETIETIMDLIEIRRNNPNQRLVVVGCLVQRYRKEMVEELPEVDAFVGVEDKDTFSEVAWEALGRKPESPLQCSSFTYAPRLLTTAPHMAYLRISDGCFHRCSFCAIPAIRGSLRSRPIEEITAEAQALAAGGVKELVIVSQDTTSYGYDLYGRFALTDLLSNLEKIEGIDWIRVMYMYPHLVDRRLAAFFATSEKLVSYIDLPIQHGDPYILKRMNRGSNDKHIRRAVDMLRSARQNMTFRTTVIVGFPGEKNHHFEKLFELLEELDFDRIGVFTYSREDGTAAENLSDHVSDRIKEKRYQKLVDWTSRKAHEKNRRFEGEILTVLVDRKDPYQDNVYWGRYYGQAPEVDGEVMIRGSKLIVGQFAPVRITECDEDNLYGYVNVEIASAIA